MLIDGGLELLDEDAAITLLSARDFGRVGVTIGALPAIFPVNYRFIDGCVVFRTAPGAKLTAALEEAVVAFEADDRDPVTGTGWSVLVIGRAEVVHDVGMTFKVLDANLQPDADGVRATIVRITPGFVSGRRIFHEPAPTQT